jgi:hypothetical protein
MNVHCKAIAQALDAAALSLGGATRCRQRRRAERAQRQPSHPPQGSCKVASSAGTICGIWANWHVQNGTPLFALQELGGWESAEKCGGMRISPLITWPYADLGALRIVTAGGRRLRHTPERRRPAIKALCF